MIDFIAKNGVEKFTSNFISPLFANEGHPAIHTIREIAIQASERSVKAYTLAMRDRADLTSVFQKFKKPVLFIAGEKDGGIPVDAIKRQALLTSHSEVHILPGVAHMGMVESENQTLDIFRRFIKKNRVTS